MMGFSPQDLLAQQQAYNNNRLYDQAAAAYDPQSGVRAADRAFHEQMLPSNYDASGANSSQQQRQDSLKFRFFYFSFFILLLLLLFRVVLVQKNKHNK